MQRYQVAPVRMARASDTGITHLLRSHLDQAVVRLAVERPRIDEWSHMSSTVEQRIALRQSRWQDIAGGLAARTC